MSDEVYITIYTFTDKHGDTKLRSTGDISKVVGRLGVRKGIELVEEYGVYPDISIEGWGKLVPRMMYYWWNELKDEIDPNGKVVGANFYKRDKSKYPTTGILQMYERFHAKFDGAE